VATKGECERLFGNLLSKYSKREIIWVNDGEMNLALTGKREGSRGERRRIW